MGDKPSESQLSPKEFILSLVSQEGFKVNKYKITAKPHPFYHKSPYFWALIVSCIITLMLLSLLISLTSKSC